MPVTHLFVSAIPDSGNTDLVQPSNWNANHVVSISNADVASDAAIAESKLSLNFATHAAVTLGTANGLSLLGQALSLGLASSGVTGALSGADWDTFNGKQSALSFPLSPSLGGTGINNGTNTLTVPATGTAALLATANVFTAAQTINVNSATALVVEQDGVKDNVLVVDTTNGRLGINIAPTSTFHVQGAGASIYLQGTYAATNEDLALTFYNGANNLARMGFFGGSGPFAAFLSYRDDVPFYIQTATGGVTSYNLAILGTGLVGLGTTAPSARLHVLEQTTTANAVKETMRLQANVSTASTGASNGFGVGLSFWAENATQNSIRQMGYITTSWVDATAATRKAKMSLSAYDTAARLGIEIEASGTAAKLGFFGVTPIVQPANNVAIDTLLSNLGLRASGGESFFDTRLMLPMGEISYFDMTGTGVTITAQSDGSTNMVKAAPTTTLNNDKEFDNGGANNGRLRYTGATTRTFHVACTISIAPAAANDTFVFGVAKNGTVIAASKVLIQATTASGIRSTAMHVMVSLATNDYLELFVGNTTDADDCTVHSLNMFAMGM